MAASRNIRDVTRRIEEGEIFPEYLARYARDTLHAQKLHGHKKTAPPPGSVEGFHEAHKIFRDNDHVESLPTTRQEEERVFDNEMKQFCENPIQFYNTHNYPAGSWSFGKNNCTITKQIEDLQMTRWFYVTARVW